MSVKTMIIKKSLYGLKTSAARWHERCADTLRKINFVPSLADYDLWMRNAGDHYEYIAVYVDDVMVYSRRAVAVMDQFKKTGGFQMKGIEN